MKMVGRPGEKEKKAANRSSWGIWQGGATDRIIKAVEPAGKKGA